MMMGLLGMIQVTDSWQLGWVRLPSYWMNSVVVETREVRDTDFRLVPDPQFTILYQKQGVSPMICLFHSMQEKIGTETLPIFKKTFKALLALFI